MMRLFSRSTPPRPSHGDAATVRAVGGFAALVMTVLHRERVVDIGQFADLLAGYSTITNETDPEAGMAVAYWAGVLKDTARDIAEDREESS